MATGLKGSKSVNGDNVWSCGGHPGERGQWLGLGDSNRDGKKHSESTYILELELSDEYNVGREKKNQNDYYPLIQQVADGSSFTKKAMSGGINRFVQRG